MRHYISSFSMVVSDSIILKIYEWCDFWLDSIVIVLLWQYTTYANEITHSYCDFDNIWTMWLCKFESITIYWYFDCDSMTKICLWQSVTVR